MGMLKGVYIEVLKIDLLSMTRRLEILERENESLRERLEAVKKQLLKEIHKAPHTWDDAVQVVQEFEGER